MSISRKKALPLRFSPTAHSGRRLIDHPLFANSFAEADAHRVLVKLNKEGL